jgi:hypothetical protein
MDSVSNSRWPSPAIRKWRASNYIAKIPVADDAKSERQIFQIAKLVWADFAVEDEDDAWELLREFNVRCGGLHRREKLRQALDWAIAKEFPRGRMYA